MQHPFLSRSSIATSAAWPARAASSRVSPHPKRPSAQWRLFACHVNAGYALEITARTSHHGLAPEDRGLPPVQCPFMMRRPITTSATRRERAAASRVSPHPKRTSAQWRLFACHVNASRALEVTALWSHHGLAPEKEKHSAGAILFSNAWTDLNQRGTARACGKLARSAISKVVVLFACHVKAGCASEITARTSHHGLAPEERSLSPVQHPVIMRKPITASAARRARAASSRISPSPERPLAQWRTLTCHVNAGFALEITARTSHNGLAPKERGMPPMQHPFLSRSSIATSAAWPARAASSRVSPHPKRPSAQWRLFACHVNAGYALEITARTSHHGLAPEDRGLPPVQCPFMMRRPITTSATRRERAAASRVSPHPKRTSAQWRLFACHVNASRALEVTALWSHHGLAPEKEKHSAGAILFSNARTNLNQRGTARACGKLARSAISKVVVLFACHVKAGCASEITARTSHHGLAPEERGLPPMQHPFICVDRSH